ncbi:MAG: methylenetetrahydrofolate reductase [NAD(P)H] [Bacteroidia bacterium]|nr:methylenetetrahydrofolate reductase [NAD(P)H] [Bacteroidia bacterium]
MASVSEILQQRSTTGFSIEILPPLKGSSIEKVFANIDQFKEFNPLYINITSHHSEPIYQTSEDGRFKKMFVRKRPGTVAVAAAIQHRYGIPAVPHIVCTGFTKSETEYVLIDLNFLGIHDLLLLRGDNNKETLVDPKECHMHASDLIAQVNDFNEGRFLDGATSDALVNKFSYGVAGYPEKHEEAPNMDSDIRYLKAKVDAGAGYVVTQMFFDNEAYFKFVDKCRAAGITVPIIPGLKPIKKLSQLSVLPKVFGVDMPDTLVKELEKCKSDADAKQVGIEWLTMQCKDLMQHGVPNLHFYTLMATDSVIEVAKRIY